MKTDKNYKMPKTVKMVLATFIDPQARNSFKHAMMQAHLFEVATRPKSKKQKNESDDS